MTTTTMKKTSWLQQIPPLDYDEGDDENNLGIRFLKLNFNKTKTKADHKAKS